MEKENLRLKIFRFTYFKKTVYTIFILTTVFFLKQGNAQTVATIGTASSTTSLSGLSSTTTTGDRNERHTCIYSAAELSAAGLASGSTFLRIGWEKTGTASYTGNDLTIRIWLKHNSSTTFPANPTFATEISTATLVYETTSGTIPSEAGWLDFEFNQAVFVWDGTDNLQVITELIRPASWTTTGFSWRTITSVTNAAANANGTTAAPPATLTRTATRPQIRLEVATTGNDAALTAMPNPVSAPPGIQNIDVVLRNAGTTTLTSADIGWTINAGPSTNFAWSGNLAPGASTTVTIGNYNFAIGSYTIEATVSNPNGLPDQSPANNVVSKNIEVCNPLSGVYTINNTLPTGGSNFNSFNDLSYFLTNCGVSGNVTVTVAPGSGPYNEQVIFQNITGLGPSATLTIEGNGRTIISDTAIIQTGSNPNRHIIRLIDLQYVTINNLKVEMFPGSTGFIGIHILNSGNHITVSNCVVDMGTGTSTLLGAIAATGSPSSLLVGGTFSNLNITGNTTMAGGYGAVIYGLNNNTTINNVISNNTISGTQTNSIYVQNNGGILISGNNINFGASNGIQLAGAGNINSLVEKNFIRCTNPTNTLTFRGIYVFGSSPANPNKVVNNVIHNMNAPAGNVIGITNRTAGAEFYFNTIILDDATATGNISWGFDDDLSNLNSLLRNNIIYVTRSSANYGAAIALPSSANPALINSNYNVIYTSGANNYTAVRKGIVMTNPPTTIYNPLNAWQAASGQDANSFQTDPLFQTGTAIPQSSVIDGQGITIAGITTDIVGTLRGSPPDPGAYEFVPPAYDAAITDFIVPPAPHCANTLDVQFELTNAGGVTLTSVTIDWTVNAVPQATYNWTGSLAPGASTIVTLGNIPVTGPNIYDFTATSSFPNGFPDINNSNDSYTYNGFRRGLEGAFTINWMAPVSATNYQSFQSIANDLNRYGVCDAVTITVLNGPYTQQVVFNTIPGTNSTNTVTLNGNGQVLQFEPFNASSDHILQLNAVTHMIVENLTVNSIHLTQGRGIHITNGSSKITIRNNNVNVSNTNSTSSAFGIIISGANWLLDGSLSDSVEIYNNTVSGGYSSIQLSGVHWTQPLTRIKVFDNTILDWYGFGVYLSYTNNAVVRNNIIRRPIRSNSGSDAVTPAGITVPAGSLGFLLEKNRIYDLHLNMPGTPTISRGIYMSGTSIAPTSGTIQNNLIYGMNNTGAQYGIQNNSVTGPVNIYHNTIVLDNAQGASTSNTSALNFSNLSVQLGMDIKNNVFYVTRGGTGIKRIFDVSANTIAFTSNYNVTWLDAPGGTQHFGRVGIGTSATIYNTLADWQATGQDLNSVHVNPLFTNPPTGDFTPTNFFADGATMGTSSVGVLDDILGNIRSANPDPGAFEFTPPPCTGANGGTAGTGTPVLCTSGTAMLTATGYSTGAGITYQWEFSNDNFVNDINDLAGQTNPASASTGVITSTTYYRLRVTCVNGPIIAYSNIVTVTVVTQPGAITQPTNIAACVGETRVFTIVMPALPGLAYQWQISTNGGATWNDIPGAIFPNLTVANLTAAMNGNQYRSVVTGCGLPFISNAATLTVYNPVAITTQPANATVCAGVNVTFTVAATGTPTPLQYQWQVSTNAGVTYTNIAGANSSTLTLTAVTTALSGNRYRVIVTGYCGSVTLNGGILTVNTATTPVNVSGLPSRICLSDTLIVLTGTPIGGVWSGVGISGNNFLPHRTAVGTYTLTYTFTNTSGCASSVTLVAKVEDCPERRVLLRDDAVIVYPNPNNGQFNIRINSTLYNYLGMRVYDGNGALVHTQNFTGLQYGRILPVDLRKLPAGVYHVKIYYDGGIRTSDKTFKIIIGGH
jgi:hypothetical protein